MPEKSHKSKLVRVSAKDLPPRTSEDVARLKAAFSRPIDTSDIPEIAQDDLRSGRVRRVNGRRKIEYMLLLDPDVFRQIRYLDPDRINQVLREHFASKRKPKRKAG